MIDEVREQDEPLVCYCGNGYEGHDESHARHPNPDYLFRDYSRCRGCHARIAWWETVKGRLSPHDLDGMTHFATCPAREQFRRVPRETSEGEKA